MPFVLKLIVLIFIVFILFTLGNALYHLARGDTGEKMVKALMWRIGLSLVLFIFIIITFFVH